MATEEEFKAAAEKLNGLTKRPGDFELLQLYGLYKQATEGDVQGKRPGMLNVKGRAKYDAWARQRGMKEEKARDSYVEFVEQLLVKYA